MDRKPVALNSDTTPSACMACPFLFLRGGGVSIFAASATVDIADTTISGNDSATKGGGGYFRLSESTAYVTRINATHFALAV